MVTEQPVTTAELVSQGYGIRTRFPEAGVHQGYCYTMGFADTFGVELITVFERGGPYTQAIDLAAKLLAKKRLDVGYMYREELANEFGEKLPLDDDIAGVIVHEIDRDDVIERYKPNIHGSHRPKWYMVQVKRSNKRITPTDFKRVYGLRYDPNKKIGVIETPYKNMLTGQLAGVALPEMTYKKYAVAGVVDLLATFMDATRKIY
jgi:hypothetical protein